jgi:hypothetical protein
LTLANTESSCRCLRATTIAVLLSGIRQVYTCGKAAPSKTDEARTDNTVMRAE